MQVIASYRFGASLPGEQGVSRLRDVRRKISDWLKSKGATDPEELYGEFASLTGGGTGLFKRSVVASTIGSVDTVYLEEIAHNDQTFITSIQAVCGEKEFSVYTTLSVSNGASIIAPKTIFPRCPRIVRDIIASYDDWLFGGNSLPRGTVIDAGGESAALDLCDLLRDHRRTFPVVVVSTDREEQVWEGVAPEIARDLVGLSHVATVDEEGSWALTDELGKEKSCYLGAIRLYWPSTTGRLSGMAWVPERLSRQFGDDAQGKKRFLSILRKNVMSASALAVSAPSEIRDIHVAAIKEKISEAERAAVDAELNGLAEENYKLTEKIQNHYSEMQEIDRLRWLVNHYKSLLEARGVDVSDGVDLGDAPEEAGVAPPVDGEIRYYKKVGSGGGVDVMERVKSCKHNSWKPAFRADQAEKGIAKLEGRADWQSIQHCGSCTGGGHWKVRW